MKKILFLVLVISLVFLAGCMNQPVQQNNNQQVQDNTQKCVASNGGCCRGNNCVATGILCAKDTVRVFEGCDKNCIPIIECKSRIPQPIALITKEFTVEADDLGLYPETLSVNKGDNVKITFEVRTDNVYYGGLDFRSDVFGNTGKVLPGSIKLVEFTAYKTFNYQSFWPSSSKLKATGTINVM